MSSLRDKIRAKRQQIQDKSAGQERTYKLQNGKTAFRILPGKGSLEDFYQEIGIHWIKDSKGKVITAVGDREICYGEPCPVRQAIEKYIDQAKESRDDDAVKHGRDMLAKSRFYVNAVIVKAPGEFEKDKPVMLDLPQTAFDSILSQIEDQLEEIEGDIDLLKEGPFALAKGLTFVIEKSGSGLETRYNAYIQPTSKPIAVPQSAYDSAVDLVAFKRSQFDERTRRALVALGDMMGTDLSDLADRLAAPSTVRKALTAPSKETSADDGLGDLDDDVIDGEIEEKEEAETEAMSDDDILADLDDL